MLYTDCQSCRTAAIARHVSFAQITRNYFQKIYLPNLVQFKQ